MINSGKYKIENNQIVNIFTGVPIPEDEPVFILRAKDAHASFVLQDYWGYCEDPIHDDAVNVQIEKFEKWQKANQDKVKEPD